MTLRASEHRILTLNAGSSSVKFAIDRLEAAAETRVAHGSIERIGLFNGRFRAVDERGPVDRSFEIPDHDRAMVVLLDWLSASSVGTPTAIGHRIVQGGPDLAAPTRLEPVMIARLRAIIPLAPNHLPGAIAVIEAASRVFPTTPQVLCFDTAFHRAMPAIAQRLPLPREWHDRGVRRYGFHGLSFEWAVEELRAANGDKVGGRVVIAHLGNGASLAAVDQGRAIDTTMGLTPLGGLVMGTRCGDLDPGTLIHLMREGRLTCDEAEELVGKRSGLLGISGTSSDMKDLLDREASDPAAAEAVEIFCRQARKHIAAMTASLGGIDTLVFTGGIGERSDVIRARIAGGLGFLGIAIDENENAAGKAVISTVESRVAVCVIAANEERIIARHTVRVIDGSRSPIPF